MGSENNNLEKCDFTHRIEIHRMKMKNFVEITVEVGLRGAVKFIFRISVI